MWGALALDAEASKREDSFPQVLLPPQPEAAASFDTELQQGEGRGRKLVTENSKPVGSGSSICAIFSINRTSVFQSPLSKHTLV